MKAKIVKFDNRGGTFHAENIIWSLKKEQVSCTDQSFHNSRLFIIRMENFGTVASYENIREEVASILRERDLEETTNVESTEYFFDVFVENNRQGMVEMVECSMFVIFNHLIFILDEIAFQSSLQDKAIERRESFAQRQPKYENEAHSKGK